MTQETGRPVIFGEVLYDSFEDGSTVLGGAPFNVAWHLHGFGFNPLFISRIGHDELGREIIAQMEAWQMDTSAIQWDERHPTGTVQISLHEGQPSFEILPDQAYDFIDLDKLAALVDTAKIPLFYHGSLALRNQETQTGFMRFVQSNKLPVFTDINLRPPWWQREEIKQIIAQSRWAKLNDDELRAITGEELTELPELIEAARQLAGENALELMVLTMGAAGAAMITGHDHYLAKPPPLKKLEDTVGAGDAFSSVCITGLLEGWPMDLTLQRALEFAARVCGERGALIRERDIYEQYRKEWVR